MNTKLKKRKKTAEAAIGKKLERLSILTAEFLEKTLTYESLLSDYAEMERLKKILLDNLWQGNINPHDPDWSPETPDEFAKMILYFHGLLTKGFWNIFKKELQHSRAMKGPIVAPAGYEDLVTYGGYTLDTFIKVKIPDTHMIVNCCLDGDTVHFFRSSVDAIPALMNLLQGLPLDNLKFCGNTECKQFIVQTTGHERKFCSGKCQSVQFQREFRSENRKKHKAYHRGYYKIIKDRKIKQKEKLKSNTIEINKKEAITKKISR